MRKFSLFIFSLLFFLTLSWLFLRSNIHVVVPQQFYRSAQLTAGSLKYLVVHKKIKTIINLRGYSPNEAWYADELAIAKTYDIKHYDIMLWAYQPTSLTNLQTLVHILKIAPKPILVHCQGGADRTGLASALFLFLQQNVAFNIATQQFSWCYLVIYSNTTAKLTLSYYQQWLQQKRAANNPASLLSWINEIKPGINYP